MKFLCADDEVDMRQILQQRLATGLRHAAKETEHNVRPLFCDVPQHSHLAERLLVGHVTHAASIQEDNVGFTFAFHPLVAARNERMRDLFRVALVHLATVSFNEKFRHGQGENNTRPRKLRHYPLFILSIFRI